MDTEKIRLFRKSLRHLELEISGELKKDDICFGLTLSQCNLLLEIGSNEEISIVQLASTLGLDTSTLSRSVDGMVNIGLVDRRQNPDDRRYVVLSLTKQGRGLFDTIENHYNDYFSRLFEGIPQEKHEQVVESFFLFSEAVKKIKPEDKCCRMTSGRKESEET